MAARPLEQVLDEVEQARVGPVQVLEDEHDGPLLGQPLEEEPPRGEEILPVGSGPLGEAEQVREPRLEPGPLLRRRGRAPRATRGASPSAGSGASSSSDPGAHPDHLGERPVGDALAVGEAAAAVPPDVVGEPVDVLLELPGEARLADPGDADDGDELGLALVRASRGRAP